MKYTTLLNRDDPPKIPRDPDSDSAFDRGPGDVGLPFLLSAPAVERRNSPGQRRLPDPPKAKRRRERRNASFLAPGIWFRAMAQILLSRPRPLSFHCRYPHQDCRLILRGAFNRGPRAPRSPISSSRTPPAPRQLPKKNVPSSLMN